MIRRALRAGDARRRDHAGPRRLGVQEQGRAGAPRRDRRLPAEPARRPAGRGRRSEVGGGGDHARGKPRRAVRGARLQGHDRPVRREADVLPRLLGAGQGRRARAQHDERQDRADRAHPPDAREPPRGARGDRRRRDRRDRRASSSRRPATRSPSTRRRSCSSRCPSRIRSSRSRSSRKTKADQDKLATGAAAARRGGSDLPRLERRGDRADAHRGDGRAAPRDHRRPPRRASSTVDGNVGRPQVAYRETITKPGREASGQVRPADGRLGPVRRRAHQPLPEPGRGLRVRRQGRRRPKSRRSTSRRSNQGIAGGDERRASSPASPSST